MQYQIANFLLKYLTDMLNIYRCFQNMIIWLYYHIQYVGCNLTHNIYNDISTAIYPQNKHIKYKYNNYTCTPNYTPPPSYSATWFCPEHLSWCSYHPGLLWLDTLERTQDRTGKCLHTQLKQYFPSTHLYHYTIF